LLQCPPDVRKRVKRGCLWSIGIVLAVVFAFAAYVWLVNWPGDVAARELRGGDSVTLVSGLTLTMPEGWTGRYTKYAALPSWLPIGQSANGPIEPQLLEQLEAQSGSSPKAPRIMSISYVRNDPFKPIAELGRTGNTVVYGSSNLTAIQVTPSKRPLVRIFVMGDTNASLDVARRYWRLLQVKGASIP
jgi:hypothetical protein